MVPVDLDDPPPSLVAVPPTAPLRFACWGAQQFTFGFSKLPTPAQIRASLADDDQLGVDDLRRMIRNYSLETAAPEVSDFFKVGEFP